jgi:hypothetical protein
MMEFMNTITRLKEPMQSPVNAGILQRSPKPEIPALPPVAGGFGHNLGSVRIYGQAIPPLYGKLEWLETGHTDCDWDRNVPDYEVFKPNSGNPVSKVTSEDKCTKSCTDEHEKIHKTQLAPVCKSYFECYTGAPKKAEASQDCKGMTGEKLKKCIALSTTALRYECFISLGDKWEAKNWECEAYKDSLACGQKLQEKSDNSCSGKIGAYIYSTQKSIEKYCKSEKPPSKAPEKPPAKKPE